jgi:lipopolysaccharide/colanic/teichoic acid biosynthesis glycosyltransferase
MAVAVGRIAYDLALPAPSVLRVRAVVGVAVLWAGLILASALEVAQAAAAGGAFWTLAGATVPPAAVLTTWLLATRLLGALRGSVPRASVWPRRSLAAGLGLALVALVARTLAPSWPAGSAVAGALVVAAGCAASLGLLRPISRVLVIGDAFFSDWIHSSARRRGRYVVAHADASVLGPGAGHDRILQAGPYDELVVQPSAFTYVYEVSPDIRARCRRLIVPVSPSVEPFASPLSLSARCFKRALDLLIAPLALLMLAPVLIATAIAIVLDSAGGPLFHQPRVGADGRQFTLFKLRTMARRNSDAEHRRYVEALIRGQAERDGGMHKLVNDRRVTRVGRIARRYSLDEIPQLLNVIKGDMSLIGPRPSLAREVELYDLAAWQRLLVKPGLSGLWQVNGRCELDFRQMVELDARYWRQWSPALEIGILLRTPWTVISGRGAA